MLNRVTALPPVTSDQKHVTVGDVLRMVLERAPQQGLTLAEMERRLPAFRKAKDTPVDAELEFAAGELTMIWGIYKDFPWAGLLPDIVEIGAELRALVEGS